MDEDFISKTVQDLLGKAGSFMIKDIDTDEEATRKLILVDLLCEELNDDEIMNSENVIGSNIPDFLIDMYVKHHKSDCIVMFRINGVDLLTYIEAVNPNYYPCANWTKTDFNTDTYSIDTTNYKFESYFSNTTVE